MTHRLFIPIALMAATLSGCAKNNRNTTTDQPRPEPVVEADAIKQRPLTAETRYAAGQLAEAHGQFDDAIHQYKQALLLRPCHTQSMYRLGCIYALQKRYPESVATWRQYVKATNESPTAYSNLAYAEELAGLPAAAEADYRSGLKKEPTNEACRINYGLMLARHGRMGEAVVQLQTVLTPAEVHFNLAAVYELEHRPEMAKIEYKQALALDPAFKDAKDKLASLGDLAEED